MKGEFKLKKVQMEFKYKKGSYSYNEPFTVYLSNSYILYLELESRGMIENGDDLHAISEKVLENGTIVDRIVIDEYLIQYAFEFRSSIFKFVILYKSDGSRYALLYDFVEDARVYEKRSNKPGGSIRLGNTYEGFLSYARFNELPASKLIKSVFFNDFKKSLHTLDTSLLNRDDFFNFFSVENINRPGEYFYFLIFDGRVCITHYTDYRNLSQLDHIEIVGITNR